jgi:transcriptional regulator of arginine metabolism
MKKQRHAALLRVIQRERVTSQERLRALLEAEGFAVTQATLSRDIRELGLAKVADPASGATYYAAGPASALVPGLEQLLPMTLLSAAGVGPLLVLKTPAGAAPSLGLALDRARWSDVLGTIAGDDTVLVIARSERARQRLAVRLRRLAGLPG